MSLICLSYSGGIYLQDREVATENYSDLLKAILMRGFPKVANFDEISFTSQPRETGVLSASITFPAFPILLAINDEGYVVMITSHSDRKTQRTIQTHDASASW